MTSIIVDGALYFNSIGNYIVKYQLATLDLSLFKKPIRCSGEVVTTEDGGLGFACMSSRTLTLWSRETSPDGALGWSKHRVIDLVTLLPDGGRSTATSSRKPYIMRQYGFLSGTQVFFVSTHVGVCMVEIKSGRAKKLLEQLEVEAVHLFPYASFCIPEYSVHRDAVLVGKALVQVLVPDCRPQVPYPLVFQRTPR
ncbi:uncharacterized protein LOC104581745 isoform X2 [Brachypodium distachyon]|uniref:uncharacterized protein LOC104581745 isoform X2 n=1 Tax=Brachypodium distachyon TaxID=15368 RepID=UPI000D0D48BC|nr:uncharacterized protein LOC104581745 isoform X2 [Brachypodium distachyon]|eukprot:XP_024313208.1 uncharacterized protein LOC104581745 isoform X2 [Brachypodium distachyon]